MKRAFFVTLLIILTASLFWLRKKPPPAPPVDVVAESEAEPEKALEAAPEGARRSESPRPTAVASPDRGATPTASAPLVAASPRPPVEPGRPRKPPAGGLSYVRKGELIVILGDLLYGRPQDPNAPQTGFVSINPVRAWEEEAIPYFIEPSLPNPDRVLKAIRYMNEKTPVHFVPFSGQTNAIVFQKGEKDCLSYLGRIGGHQPIKLDANCEVGEILHEILHALGFVHEQSRGDRDQFVQINWLEVQPENRTQFEVAPDELTKLSMSAPFDYQSVMLYRSSSFATTPGQVTLQSRTTSPVQPAEDSLSPGDIERLYKIYGR